MEYVDKLPEDVELILKNTFDEYKYNDFITLYRTLIEIDEDDELEDRLVEYCNTINYQSNPLDDITTIVLTYVYNLLREYGLLINTELINMRYTRDIVYSLHQVTNFSELDSQYVLDIISDEYTAEDQRLANLVAHYTDTSYIEIIDVLADIIDDFWKPFIIKLEYLIEINQPDYIFTEDTLVTRLLKDVIEDIYSYYDYSNTLLKVVLDLLNNNNIKSTVNEIFVYFKHTEEYLNKNDRLIFVDDVIYSDLQELDIEPNIINEITKQVKQRIIQDTE